MLKLSIAITIVPLFACAAWAQAPKKLDPCALVTKAEVQEAVGSQVADPKPNKLNASVCDFSGTFGNVSFLVRQNGPGETPDRIMAELKKAKINTEEVKGIGDRSFYAAMGYGMVQLNSFKGPNYVIATVLIPGAPEAKSKAIAASVMKKALAKL